MKHFVQPDTLRLDSFKLAAQVVESGFKPDFIVGIFRGGCPIGCHVDEFLKYMNINADHIAVRTSRYTGIDQVAETIAVHNLGYLVERLNKDSKVLVIDDVYDSGLSIEAFFDALKEKLCCKMPINIHIGTIFYKPSRNKTGKVPEYFVHESDEWIVFPHELEGLSIEEINTNMGKEIGDLVQKCQSNKN
jgi:hypoxanthine phosphoribosyltransferase